jgi:hypothetical protein
LGYFFLRCNYFDKNGLGYILGTSYKLIWSPCSGHLSSSNILWSCLCRGNIIFLYYISFLRGVPEQPTAFLRGS